MTTLSTSNDDRLGCRVPTEFAQSSLRILAVLPAGRDLARGERVFTRNDHARPKRSTACSDQQPRVVPTRITTQDGFQSCLCTPRRLAARELLGGRRGWLRSAPVCCWRSPRSPRLPRPTSP